MPQTTGKNDLFLNGLAKITDGLLAAMQKEADYPKYVNVRSTKKQREFEQGLENMRAVSRLPEGAAIPEMDYDPGYAQNYTQGQWAGRYSITEAMQQFAMGGFIEKLNKRLTLSTYQAKEIIGASYLDYGSTAQASVPFVGGAPLINSIGGDGVTLFNTAHPFRSDPTRTWTNKAAAYADISETSINTVFVDVAGWKDNNNAPLNINPKRIIHPVAQHQRFLKVQKSLLEPGSNNNAVNTSGMLFENLDNGLMLKWLVNANNWYAETTADQDDFGLQFYFGWEDMVKKGYDTHTWNSYVGVMFSLAHGANQLRTLYAVQA